MIEALLVASGVALCSVVGALFFGEKSLFHSLERFIIPVAVGVFLALSLYGLIPEVVLSSPEWGGLVVAGGFLGFYLLAYLIHKKLHAISAEHSEKQEAAILILIGDAVHNFADGIVIGGAFLVAPEVGVVAALAVALHEIPQEIVEFGVLIRAGYTRVQAVFRNLLSASMVVVGTFLTMVLAGTFSELVWVLSALAAGNLLYIAASELLPRLHSSHQQYGGFTNAFLALLIGFVGMTTTLYISHEKIGHAHGDGHVHHEEMDTHAEHDVDHHDMHDLETIDHDHHADDHHDALHDHGHAH